MDTAIRLTAATTGGMQYVFSADPEDTIAEAVEKLKKIAWAHFEVEDFEKMWIDNEITLIRDDQVLGREQQVKDCQLRDGDALLLYISPSLEDPVQRQQRSRLRLAKMGRSKLVPPDLRNTCFSRDLISRATHALQQGLQLSGYHKLQCRNRSAVWSEENWSWTLLYDRNSRHFAWRHHTRQSRDMIEQVWESEEQFIDFWTQLSDASACAYTALLVYGDDIQAVLLEGAPTAAQLNPQTCNQWRT